jgi:hypothetical protein
MTPLLSARQTSVRRSPLIGCRYLAMGESGWSVRLGSFTRGLDISMTYLEHVSEGGNDMLDVSVKVPEDRIAEFYAMYGRWLASPGGEGSADEQHISAETGAVEWGPDDIELAATVWAKFSPRARAVFSTLIDEPGERYFGEELARLHNIPNGSHGVAGVLAWPSRHCVAAGRRWCWKWDNRERGAVYWMDDTLAQLFRQARG